MIDAELRGWLLLRFYDRRNSNGGSVPVDDIIVSGIEHVGREAIREVCEQLADVELIHWEPLTGANEGPVELMWLLEIEFPLRDSISKQARGRSPRKGDEPMSADKPREGTGPLSSWQGFLPPNPSGELSPVEQTRSPKPIISRKVFIVHGHDGEAKAEVARFLEKLGFTPIILHEQASKGRTIIEKVESTSDVGFAVVLLTPDDEGNQKGKSPKPRARQNVVLELGYFVGRLGRDRVCALRRGDVEIPSDFDGVVYETYDEHGAWKSRLAKELEAAEFKFDWAKVHA